MKRNMAIEKQESTQESQIRLTKQPPCSSTYPIIIIDDDDEETLDSKIMKPNNLNSSTINSMGSLRSNDHAIAIIDKEETRKPETLEPNKKKPRLGSWWDYVDSSNELSSVVKGLPKNNDDVSRVDSYFSSTNLHDKKKKDDLSEEKSIGSGYRHVALEELGVTVEDLKSMPWEVFDPIWEIRSETMDPWLGGYIEDILSPDHYNSQD